MRTLGISFGEYKKKVATDDMVLSGINMPRSDLHTLTTALIISQDYGFYVETDQSVAHLVGAEEETFGSDTKNALSDAYFPFIDYMFNAVTEPHIYGWYIYNPLSKGVYTGVFCPKRSD